MWELTVTIKMSVLEVTEWNEDGESGVNEEWSKEEVAATLKVKVDHTETDSQGEYLPDDEITYDKVYEAVENWMNQTGIKNDDHTKLDWEYNPEKAKKVK